MSPPASRLSSILSHLLPSLGNDSKRPLPPHIHTLSPTSFLPRAAAIEPDAVAIHHVTIKGNTLRRTYAEFSDRACGLAYWLKHHGFQRVGILAPNTPTFLECIFGIAAAGAIFVPVNYRLKPEDITYIFEFARVDYVIVDAEFFPLLHHFRKQNPGIDFVVDSDTHESERSLMGDYDAIVLEGLRFDVEGGEKRWEGLHAQAEDEDDCIAIPFTSGTTARPKGVVYTHRGSYLAALGNVIESGLNIEGGLGEVSRYRCGYLWTLPMFHAVGWTFPWAVTAVRGTHYCLRKVDYPLIWSLLKSEPITHFNAAPTVNTLLCAAKEAERLEHPVKVTVAASPPTAHLFQTMTDLNLLPVHVYGLTETYGPLTKGYYLPSWSDLPIKKTYENMARQGHGFITNMPIRVIKTDQKEGVLVDVKRDGKEIGEIVFYGNICAKGYWNDTEATRKLFAGGVLHSGDLAVWHSDESAQILDRAKDIIISGGENISSVALESMLVQHPSILECGVVAISDEQWGERPKAFVTLKEGHSLTGEEVITWAKNESGISRFMVPKEVEVVDELPKTSTGKVKKNVLRKWAVGDYGEK